MNWAAKFEPERIDLHTPGRISEKDARRQVATVEEILKRLEHQPGLILADEVGMGKTFVALAVAISVAWARPEADHVRQGDTAALGRALISSMRFWTTIARSSSPLPTTTGSSFS